MSSGDRKGRVLFREGVSPSNFLLALADVRDPEGLTAAMEGLRTELLDDPYFSAVPSMQPGTGKTAVFFHAKDDIPEVRHKVFSLLARQDLKFLAEVRSMERQNQKPNRCRVSLPPE